MNENANLGWIWNVTRDEALTLAKDYCQKYGGVITRAPIGPDNIYIANSRTDSRGIPFWNEVGSGVGFMLSEGLLEELREEL